MAHLIDPSRSSGDDSDKSGDELGSFKGPKEKRYQFKFARLPGRTQTALGLAAK